MRAVFTARLVWLLMEISDNSREMENYDQPESHVPCHHITCCRTPVWIRVYSFLLVVFLQSISNTRRGFRLGRGGCSRSDLAAACCCCSCWFLLEKDAQIDRNSLSSLFPRTFEKLLSVLSSPVSS